MPVPMEKTNPPASEALIAALEREIGARLPTDYRGFLLRNDGACPADNQFDIPPTLSPRRVDPTAGDVREFLSVSEVVRMRKLFGTRLPTDVIPIADAACGNLVCLNVSTGAAYYFDHELEDQGPLLLAAPSFDALLGAMRPGEDVHLDPDDVVYMWTRPGYRPDPGKPGES